MKTIRAMYVTIMYILGLPLLVLGTMLMAVYICVVSIRDEYDRAWVKDLFMAYFEGCKQGHMVNMHFIKYGRNGCYGNEEVE